MHDANTISRTAPCFQPPRFKKKIYSGMILRISDGCFTSKCQRLPQVFRLRESSGSIFKRDRCLPLYASACVRITSSWLVGYIESIEHERIMHVALPTRIVSHAALQDKKLSYRRGTARCVVSVEVLPIATQQCRNYLYDKS